MFNEKSKNPVVEPKNRCYSTTRYETYEEARVAKATALENPPKDLSKIKIVKRSNGDYFELKLYRPVK